MTEVPIPNVAAVPRATLLVFGHAGAHADGSLEQELVGAAVELRERLGDGGTVRVGVRLDDDPLAAVARERNLRLLDGAVEVDASRSR